MDRNCNTSKNLIKVILTSGIFFLIQSLWPIFNANNTNAKKRRQFITSTATAVPPIQSSIPLVSILTWAECHCFTDQNGTLLKKKKQHIIEKEGYITMRWILVMSYCNPRSDIIFRTTIIKKQFQVHHTIYYALKHLSGDSEN